MSPEDEYSTCRFEIKEAKQDIKLIEKELHRHLIESSEEKAIRRQTQSDIVKLEKAVNGNGDPGVKQRVGVVEGEILTLYSEIEALRKLVWWMMSIIGLMITGTVALSKTGVI